MGKLANDRREMFCQYYVTELKGRLYNGTESAIKAGYSKKTAYSQANRLLKIAEIQRRIEEIKQEVMDQLGIDQLYVLNRYKKIIDDDIRNYLSFRSVSIPFINEDGDEDERNLIDINIKDSETVDTWNISEISRGKDGQFKFKLHCKDHALSKMAEYVGLFEPEKDENKETLNKLDAIMQTLDDQAQDGDE